MKYLVLLLFLFLLVSNVFAVQSVFECKSKEASIYPDKTQVVTINLITMTALESQRAPIDGPMKLYVDSEDANTVFFKGTDFGFRIIRFSLPKAAATVNTAFKMKIYMAEKGEYGWFTTCSEIFTCTGR